MDEKEFTDKYKQTYDYLLGYLTKLIKDRSIAEEVAQEAYARAWKSRHTYKPEYRYRTWLVKVALNAMYAYYGREKKHQSTNIDEEYLDTHDVELAIEIQKAQDNLENLRPIYKDIAKLFYVEGLVYSEIAAILNIHIDTVTNRMHWARKQLVKMHIVTR